MYKWLVAMLSFILLIGCRGEEETIGEESFQEVEEVEEGNEGEEVEENPDEEDSEEGSETALPDPVTVEEEIYSHQQEEEVTVQAEVGPLFVEDEHVILPIIFDNLSDIDIQLSDIIHDQFVMEDLTSQRDIRLIDPRERTASHIGIFTYEREADQGTSFNSLETVLGTGSRNERTTMGPEQEPTYYYAVFEAPVSEDIHVLLPKLGLVENVPVVARDEAELPTVAEVEEALEREEEIEGPHAYGVPTVLEIMQEDTSSQVVEQLEELNLENVYVRTMPLETYRESVETTVSRVDEVEHSTLILSADVLFEFDEAALTDEADRELEAALLELEGVEGGVLDIVGHTDNQGSEEYNQELSEERAASVEARLGELADLEQFDEIQTRGESFREPIADNETEEGQTQNRRVELHFTPPTEQIVIESEGELPEAVGVEVEYPETANVADGQVEIQSLTRVDDFFVGRLKVNVNEGELGRHALQAFGTWTLTGARGRSYRDSIGFSPSRIYTVSLLHGNQRYYPIDYYMSTIPGTIGEEEVADAESGEEVEDVDYIIPLAEHIGYQTASSDEDAYYLATVIWPAIDTDEVAVELSMPELDLLRDSMYELEIDTIQPWRILNVPVETQDQD